MKIVLLIVIHCCYYLASSVPSVSQKFMSKMNPKEINRRAGKIFESKIPDNCVIRPQEDQEDYGIDYELELMEPNDKATGFIFKVQQKGQETAVYSPDAKYLVFSGLSVERMTYYLEKVRIPVVVSVVDIATDSAVWIILHGNPEINKAYSAAVAAGQETMSIKIPVANRLPDTFDKLIAACGDANKTLINNGIIQTSSSGLIEAALKQGNEDFKALAEAFAKNHDIARIMQIDDAFKKGDLKTAASIAEKIFDSPSERMNMRFSAALNLFKILPSLLAVSPQTDKEKQFIAKRNEVSAKLLKITRTEETSRSLKIYSIYFCRAVRLHELVTKDTGLFLSRRAQQESGDSFAKAVTDAAQNQVTFSIINEINHIQRYVPWLMGNKAFHLVPMVWDQFIIDIGPFIARIKFDGFQEAANQLVQLLDKTATMIIDISRKLGNWNDVVTCSLVTQFLELQYSGTADYKNRTAAICAVIEAIPDENIREKGLKDLEAQTSELEKANSLAKTPEPDDEYYRKIASALGVNLSDENDNIARVINIGIRDRNPERVLKNCSHLFVEIFATGIPAQMIGLNTAGMKTLVCKKFGFGLGGLSLDGVYELFKKDRCDKCDSCSPHPYDWKWNYKWQEEQTRLVDETRNKNLDKSS